MLKAAKIARNLLVNLVVMFISVTCLFPVIWLIYSSMKTSAEFDISVVSLPSALNLENFKKVLEISNMERYMLNSILIAGFSVVLTLLFSFVIGYFLARYKFKFSKAIYGGFLVGMLIPVHSLMIPIYVIFSKLGLNDRLLTLVLPYVAFQLPVAMYIVESYIHSIPVEVEEAAAIDGANFSTILFKIVFPMTLPALTTAGIIAFFYCWNEFSFALVLTTQETLRTIPHGLTMFNGSYTTNYPMLMAAMTIAIAPALILYGLFSKNIMNGMLAGAVKG